MQAHTKRIKMDSKQRLKNLAFYPSSDALGWVHKCVLDVGKIPPCVVK